ncbi:alpha/beta fold hydrolase [Streptomyces katrae]|uniref:alpha/beta fold hydrolase n=1 Tax=Streptomyces katrae TaxID=68223 RepID=UPI000AEAE0F2
MRASAHLGDLGGASKFRLPGRRLILLGLRGTGGSAIPADESPYRVDHQVADVEALRVHLGLERMDVLAHSAGGNLAQLYAAAHPDRVRADPRRPGGRRHPHPGGLAPDDAARLRALGRGGGRSRRGGRPGEERGGRRRLRGPGAFDPPATRAGLRRVAGEVLVLAGEPDSNPTAALAAELAGSSRTARSTSGRAARASRGWTTRSGSRPGWSASWPKGPELSPGPNGAPGRAAGRVAGGRPAVGVRSKEMPPPKEA